MLMSNLIEYRNNYLKTSGSLWENFKEIPVVNNAGNIVDCNGANTTDSFIFKIKITGQTAADNNNGNVGRVEVEIMIPLKYVSNFWRTVGMPLINCKIELILDWSANCYNLHKYCKSSSYIYNNRDKSLCSSSHFINSR